MKIQAVFILLAFAAAAAGALSPFEEGEKLYAANEPLKARALLEEALKQEPGNPKVYAYLAIVYEQLGDPDRAIAILRRGLPVAGDLKATFYFDMGNNYARRGEQAMAEKMYGEALALNEAYAKAWLNRAGARVDLESYEGAIADYTMYLRLEPQSRKRPEVEKMIELLSAWLSKKESAERDRLARERALMEQVLEALRNASEDAQNLSTRSDRILEEKEEEIDIDQ
jgi:tetratricopeptide (TPR) repeat protein